MHHRSLCLLAFSSLWFVETWSGDCGDCLASSDGDCCYCCNVFTRYNTRLRLRSRVRQAATWYSILRLRCLPPDDTAARVHYRVEAPPREYVCLAACGQDEEDMVQLVVVFGRAKLVCYLVRCVCAAWTRKLAVVVETCLLACYGLGLPSGHQHCLLRLKW